VKNDKTDVAPMRLTDLVAVRVTSPVRYRDTTYKPIHASTHE